MEDFSVWVNTTYDISLNNITSSAVFYNHLKVFANDSENAAWHSNIIYDDESNPSIIDATRFTLPAVKNINVKKQYPEYLEWNELIANYTNGFIFTADYQYAYLANIIVLLTIENMVFACVGVFVILLILLDVRLAVYIVIIVGMIDVNLFGWMYLFNISLDSVSYAQLVMAVGLTVDYVIHITHAIAIAQPIDVNDYEQRITIALQDMGASVCKGAFTTLLGVCALYFSKAKAFRIFFEMFSGIILIAVAHGLILTPAILGECTWIWRGVQYFPSENNSDVSNKKSYATKR